MGATTGVQQLGTYSAAGATSGVLTQAQANVDALLALIPNPDVAPAQAGGAGTSGTFLDEMSPPAAAQLRVELLALKASMA